MKLDPHRWFRFSVFPCLVVLGAVNTGTADDLAEQTDAMFARFDRPDSPGCAVGIIRDGKLVYSKGFGSANLDYQAPITTQTCFEIASFTKSFTTVSIAMLMDEGKVGPDDDIRKFLPEMHDFDPPITVLDLLRCRSGLRDYIHLMPLAGWPLGPSWVAYSNDDVYGVLSAQRTLQFPSGSKFGYSNSDYFLLGQIVERAGGQPLAEFAHDNIFQPLGMKRTAYVDRPAHVLPQRAVGYVPRQGGWNAWVTSGAVMGACGVRTCVEDLYRWDQNFYHNKLPRGKYLDAVLLHGELLGNRNCLDADNTDKYRGARRMQFTGGGWGSVSAMSRYPDHRFTAICLSNHDLVAPWKFTREIADLYLATNLSPTEKKKETEQPTETAESDSQQSSALDLSKLAGAYMDKYVRVWHVAVDGQTLTLTNNDYESFNLERTKDGRYRSDDLSHAEGCSIRFRRVSPGGSWALLVEKEFGPVEFKKLAPPTLSAAQLNDFRGRYASDELMATYRFRVTGGKLMLQINNLAWEELDPIAKDQFVPHRRHTYDARFIKFERNAAGEVDALEIGSHRAQGVRFTKQPGAQSGRFETGG